MKQFIEITVYEAESKKFINSLINTNWIYEIRPNDDGRKSIIRLTPLTEMDKNKIKTIFAEEAYEKIKGMF